VALAWVAAAGVTPGRAAGADPRAYLAAIRATRAVLHEAAPGDSVKAGRAIQALGPEVTRDQPEVVADLNRVPPDFADADLRLGAAESALARPADTADPAAATRTLDRILSDPRYQVAGPSLLDRFWAWVLDALRWFFEHLPLNGMGWLGLLLELAILAAALAAVAYFGYRLMRDAPSTAGGGLSAEERQRLGRDRFAAADRLAEAGDLAGAIRALAGGVATILGGEGAWEASPFTVRELFQQSGLLVALSPLLVPFERSEYGRHVPSAEDYAAALAVAAPYRPGAVSQVAA
jgi:hypothetical protein